MSRPQSMYDVAKDQLDIPLPTRPGTFWTPNTGYLPDGTYVGYAATRCEQCGKGYNSHGAHGGAGSGESRHACPASDAAWAAYYDARRRANLDAFHSYITHELSLLSEPDRRQVIDRLLAAWGAKLLP